MSNSITTSSSVTSSSSSSIVSSSNSIPISTSIVIEGEKENENSTVSKFVASSSVADIPVSVQYTPEQLAEPFYPFFVFIVVGVGLVAGTLLGMAVNWFKW